MLLTLEQQQQLVSKGLAVAKTNGNLITFKYHRKVMYDYLWKKHPELLECRGHTYDLTNGNLVLAAPTKSFNYLEDGHWKDVPLNTRVNIYKKFNGFMATMSVYKGEVVIGTTGTTNSDYTKMAREMIFKDWPEHLIQYCLCDSPHLTFLYEICHPNDPHIVEEKSGAWHLGYRSCKTDHHHVAGEYVPEEIGEYHQNITLDEALEIVGNVKHEGFMVYDQNGNVCKLKSPYYVGKKKLMRMNVLKVHDMFRGVPIDGLPSMWDNAVSEIKKQFTADGWNNTDEQDRRAFLESLE